MDAAFRKLQAEKAAERGETAPKAEPREQRQAPEPRTDKPLMRKGRSQGWVVAPQIGEAHQAEIPDAPTRRARGPRRGRDAKASNVADGRLAWQAGNWKPHPDGNKGGPCGDLILAARHALDEGHPEGWPPRRRDDVHEAIEQREPFSWLGVDGQPVPLESDEQVLALIQAHGGNARRAAYAMTSGLGAAAEAGARKRFDQQRKLVLRAAAQGATPSCVGSRPLAAQLFDPARPPTRETRLFAALPGFMAGVSTKPRSKRSRRYMVPPDLTKRKSGVAAGQARVEEFKRKEREAKLKADEDARKAAEAQTRAENGNKEEDKKESSSDDDEPEARRRLERRGRGLGRADAAQRWRDLEAKADQLCQRAQRHQPKAEKEPVKEAPSKKRRKKAQESSDDDDDVVPVAKNDQRPTLAECVAILREAEDLPDCPPSIGGVGEDPVSMLKEKLDEVWRHVARCRLLAARARDCVARGSAAEHSSAYDARGFGYSVYARTNADGTPKQTANEIVAAGVGVSRSGARGLSTSSNVEDDEEEDVVAGLGAMSEREPTLPLEDAEACLRQLKQHCIRDDDALRPLAACLRAASAWRRKAHDSLEGQGAPARQIAPGQLLGLAQRGRAMPFVEEDLCAQLEERAQDARDLDRELSRALDGVTTPNLQTLKELRERCRDFVGVKLEARRELDSLCDAAEQWAKDARRILTDPHAKKAPTKARRLLEQLTEIKCGVGPMGVTLQEQVAKADKWTEQALSVYEGGGDDYAALGRLVDAAEDVPAPRRALTACSRRHRFLQWVREARGALVACSVREPGDHDEVIRPGIQDAKDHLESLDELRKGATDDLAKLARKQHEDPAVILHPEKRGEVEEIDPVQKGEDRRAASNARKEALLEAKRKQEEEKARLAEKKPPPPEDTDSSSEDYSDHEDVNQCQRRKLTALTIRKAARDATHVSEEESQLREILAKAESWAARAKALKPATCAGGLTEIPHEKLMAAPTLAQLKKLVDQGESLAIDCTIQLRPLRTASRQAGAWLHNSRDVRRKLNLEATTDVKLWVTTTNDSDSDDSDAVVKQESGDEDDTGVTALQLSSCLAQARRLGAKVDELAQLRQLGSRVDAWRARHRELCPRRSTLIDDQPQKSSTRSKASEKARQLAEEEAARANVREPSKAEKRRPVYLTIGACTGDAKPTPDVLRTLDAALNTLPLDMDVERQALADRLTAASELKSEVRTLLSDVGERCVGLLPNHTARLARLETGDSDSEDSDSEDSDDAPLVPRPAPVVPMDVDSAVKEPAKPPQKPRPKKLSRQERLDRDELERDALPEDDERGRGVLRAELVLKREVEGALAKAPRVRTADERRLERCLDILAWCAAARRITAVACAAQAREERAFEAKDRAQKALQSLREAEHVTDEMRDGQLRLSREAAELADRADRGEAVDADELSGIDRDRQLLWHGLQARDANDQEEDIRCLVPWEQLHKYWSLRIAALRDKFGQLHGWRDEARKALERRDAPLVSVLEDLLTRGAALQQKMTSRRDRRGIMDACDSLRRRKKWIFDARDALRSGPKRKLKAVDALAREATKVGLGDCEDARALRSAARAARAWFAKVKRTGIERGEASISELRALLPEAAKIRVDISGDVDVVKQASLQVCLCASPADGQMLQCESCAMQFHARCVGRGGPDLEPLVSKKRPQPLNAAAKKKARLLDQDRQAAQKAAQAALDALAPPSVDEDPETRYKSVSNVSTEPFTCARCVLERFAASEREATERTLENNIGAWVDGVRNIVQRPTGDTLALAAVRCVSKAPKDPPQLMRSVDDLVKQCPPETAQPLRRLAWAYAAAALLRAPPRCRDVIPITSAAPSLGIPDLPLQHFSGCLERGAVLRRRLAQLCRRPEPRSRPKPKPKPTPDEVVEEPPQEEEPPEEAEVKTSSSRGKERKVDVTAVKAVLEASRHIPLRLETLRRRCAAIIDDGGKRYCFCRGPSDGAFMLGCNDGSACGDEWFHGRCVGVEEADEKAADEFVCSKCKAARANEETPPIREFVAFGDEVSDDEDTPETLAALAKEDRGEAQFSLPWPPALLGASPEFKEAVEKQQAERSAQQSSTVVESPAPPWAAAT